MTLTPSPSRLSQCSPRLSLPRPLPTFSDFIIFSPLSFSLLSFCLVFFLFFGFYVGLRCVYGRPHFINCDNWVTRTRTAVFIHYLISSVPFRLRVSLFSFVLLVLLFLLAAIAQCFIMSRLISIIIAHSLSSSCSSLVPAPKTHSFLHFSVLLGTRLD